MYVNSSYEYARLPLLIKVGPLFSADHACLAVQNITLTRMVCEHAWVKLPGGADIDAGLSIGPEWEYVRWLNHRPHAGCLPLAHLAVMHDSLFLLGLMHKRGADMTVRDEHGLTPLFRACKVSGGAVTDCLAVSTCAEGLQSVKLPLEYQCLEEMPEMLYLKGMD